MHKLESFHRLLVVGSISSAFCIAAARSHGSYRNGRRLWSCGVRINVDADSVLRGSSESGSSKVAERVVRIDH